MSETSLEQSVSEQPVSEDLGQDPVELKTLDGSDTQSEAIENESNEPEDESAEDDAEAEAKKPAKGFERRIKKLTAKKDQEIAFWREQALKTAGVSAEPTVQEPVQAPSDKPKRFEFASDDDFYEALSDWKVEAKLAEREQRSKQMTVAEKYQAKVVAFMQERPDFQEVLQEIDDLPLPNDMVELILESEVGPQISLYLAENEEEAVRLTKLSPTQRAKALGRIEATLEKQPTKKVAALEKKKVSTAPAPITSVKGTAPVEKSIYDDNLSYSEWVKLRNKK